MKIFPLLGSFFLVALPLLADGPLNGDYTRLMDSQQRALQAVVEPVQRKFAVAWLALYNKALAAKDADTAAKVKIELDRLNVKIPEPLVPAAGAGPSLPANLPKGSYLVDSKSDTGTVIGPGHRNQKVSVQYSEGLWSTSGNLKFSPDSPRDGFGAMSLRGDARGETELIAVLPAGTKMKPFIATLAKDYDAVRLVSNDTDKTDNEGEVIYKATIR